MIQLQRAPGDGVVPGYRWAPGDRLARIGGTAIADILDFYYLSEEEGSVELVIVDTADRADRYTVQTAQLTTLAHAFAPMEFKTCAARCVFCFIDQNPQGLRESIYVKDEDYRLSFLYGNYITLTSLGRQGLRRVLTQKLSPLYVSVHATDVEVRTRLLGIKRRMDVMGALRQLALGGITVHGQIVLCPGWNDGDVLTRTLDDLASLYPQVASIAVVPVGLSDHRAGLTQLRPVTAKDAARAIDQVTAWGDRFLARKGTRLAFTSDEFFLRCSRPFPPPRFYEDLPQEDNGIGICPLLREEVRSALPDLRAAGRARRTVTIVTGTLAEQFFEHDLRPLLSTIPWLDLRVVGVVNRLYGAGISVAGLLCGRDFLQAIQALPAEAGAVLIPDVALNHDGLFLDDLSEDDFLARAGRPVHVAREGLVEALLRCAGA